ncbi:MAG TPA: hypothetical protein V6D18_11785 [Thermosynechococcaceae cyanobacterium]
MIVLTEAQANVLRTGYANVLDRLLTHILLSETYQLSDVEDALIWLAPENRQILCPFDSLWARNLAQEIARELNSQR